MGLFVVLLFEPIYLIGTMDLNGTINSELTDIPIGVIGLGDLGSKLVVQLLISGKSVVAFDPRIKSLKDMKLGSAVDPNINVTDIDKGMIKIVSSPDDILAECDVVHWAVQSNKVSSLGTVLGSKMVILHDSVMNNSVCAIYTRADSRQFAIAHCLMNDYERVVVSPDHGEYEFVVNHFSEIGLHPKTMSVAEHDRMMARTQGVFALLIDYGIGNELDARFEAGDLTPSATELRAAVKHRESNWTEATIKSILENPELKPFIDEISESLNEL